VGGELPPPSLPRLVCVRYQLGGQCLIGWPCNLVLRDLDENRRVYVTPFGFKIALQLTVLKVLCFVLDAISFRRHTLSWIVCTIYFVALHTVLALGSGRGGGSSLNRGIGILPERRKVVLWTSQP